MVFFNFEGSDLLMPAMDSAKNVLHKYAGAANIELKII